LIEEALDPHRVRAGCELVLRGKKARDSQHPLLGTRFTALTEAVDKIPRIERDDVFDGDVRRLYARGAWAIAVSWVL